MGLVGSLVVKAAALSAVSVRSLPGIPLCPGIHRRLVGPGRLQPLRGDPDNPPPEGTNAIAQARTPQARLSKPAREKKHRYD